MIRELYGIWNLVSFGVEQNKKRKKEKKKNNKMQDVKIVLETKGSISGIRQIGRNLIWSLLEWTKKRYLFWRVIKCLRLR